MIHALFSKKPAMQITEFRSNVTICLQSFHQGGTLPISASSGIRLILIFFGEWAVLSDADYFRINPTQLLNMFTMCKEPSDDEFYKNCGCFYSLQFTGKKIDPVIISMPLWSFDDSYVIWLKVWYHHDHHVTRKLNELFPSTCYRLSFNYSFY